MINLKHATAAAAALILISGPSYATLMEATTFDNVDSVAVIATGSPPNVTKSYTATNAATYPYILESLSWDGFASEVNSSGSYMNELRVEVTLGGKTVVLALGTGDDFVGEEHITGSASGAVLGDLNGLVVSSGDVFSFMFHEAFDDINGADANWRTITFSVGASCAGTNCVSSNPTVPEPATLALLGLGLTGLGLMRRRIH